ncbi:MAG: ribosomal protein L37E [Cocleimonas sp.]|jgi:ribosomal protein L37E
MAIDRDKIAKKLNEKGATLPCHRCGQVEFTVLEGFTSISLQDDFSGGLVLGGATVPVAHIVCKNCGAITPHALGALDMLPKKEATNGEL